MFKEILSAISAIEAAPKRKTHMLDGLDLKDVYYITPCNPLGIGLTLADMQGNPIVNFTNGNFGMLLKHVKKELHDITDEFGQRYVVFDVEPGKLIVLDLKDVAVFTNYQDDHGIALLDDNGQVVTSSCHASFDELKSALDDVFQARQAKKYSSVATVVRPTKALVAGHVIELADVTSYKPWMGRTKGIVVMSGNEKLINHSDCDYEEESAKLEKALNLYLGY